MGWTFEPKGYMPRKDVRGAVDAMLDGKAVKSVMVGSTYYAAVKDEDRVIGLVVKTSVRNTEYCNFGTKFISEDAGPCERQCPDSILKLLSPTDNEWAIAWRKASREYNEAMRRVKRLPVGTKIKCRGNEYMKIREKGHQWFRTGGISYIPVSWIAERGFEVV